MTVARAKFYTLGFVLAFGLLAAFGCGGALPVPQPAPSGADRQVVLPDEEEEDGLPAPGDLPIGYNQRQCQWDACGGPLPNQLNPAINPQPGER